MCPKVHDKTRTTTFGDGCCFVVSASFFIVSSIRNGDIVGLLGGVFFLLACVAILASYLGGGKD